MEGILRDIGSFLSKIFTWWVIVTPWEKAIRLRMGKYKTVLGTGIHLKVPVIDIIIQRNMRMRVCALSVQTMTTRDNKTLTLAGTVGYSIENLELLYDTLHHAEDTIQNLVMSAIAQYIHTHDAVNCSPEKVEDSTSQSVDLAKYGLNNVRVRITDFAFVRTYRLIKDEQRYPAGGSLDTGFRSDS